MKFSGRQSLIALATTMALVSPASSAQAQRQSARRPSIANALPKGEALEHLKLGNRHLDLKNFDDAIAEYKKGALLEPLPVFFVNLGIAHREAGRYQQAIDAFRLYLDKISGDPLEADIRRKIEPLIESMQKALTQPPRTPEPVPTESNATAPAPADAAQASTSSAQEDDPTSSPPWFRDPWGWTAVGTGVAAAIAGGIALSSASSKEDAANRESNIARQRDLRSQADTRWWLGGGLTAAGGVLIAAGGVLLALPSRSSREVSSVRISPGPGDAGVAFSLSF